MIQHLDFIGKESIFKVLESKGYEVKEVEVVKNNVKLKGICIGYPEDYIRPTIYYDPTWRECSDEEIVEKIITIYQKSKEDMPEFNKEKILDLEFIKNNSYICVQRPSKEPLIKRKYLDLELYIRIKISNCASFKLNSNIIKEIPDLKEDELFEWAINNTKEEIIIKSINDIFNFDETEADFPFLVVSTKDTINGASCIYFKEIFRKICKEYNLDKGAYIIPSSIHECLVLLNPELINEDKFWINEMINEVNYNEVSETERLSNHYYFYDIEKDEVTY